MGWVMLVAMAVAMIAPVARAASSSSNDDEVLPDGRLEGYKDPVVLKDSGTAGTVLFMFVLMGITFGVMFINAKRSHLD
jgi:hypothetical protein